MILVLEKQGKKKAWKSLQDKDTQEEENEIHELNKEREQLLMKNKTDQYY